MVKSEHIPSIYFASPFFNEEQVEREERLKKKLRELGFLVWSPKENCNCPPDASDELRQEVFYSNTNAMVMCDIIFVVTDGKDMGSIWEAGFVCGWNEFCGYFTTSYREKKVVYYCETLGSGQFNLMLAQSGDVVITEFGQLDKLEELLQSGNKYVGQIE